MRLTSWEEERLLIFSAAELARRHRAAGIALNAPEAIALICDAMLEAARAGARYAEVEAAGLAALAPGDVLAGVRELVDEVRLEVLLVDGHASSCSSTRSCAAPRRASTAQAGSSPEPGMRPAPARRTSNAEPCPSRTPPGAWFGSRHTSRSIG